MSNLKEHPLNTLRPLFITHFMGVISDTMCPYMPINDKDPISLNPTQFNLNAYCLRITSAQITYTRFIAEVGVIALQTQLNCQEPIYYMPLEILSRLSSDTLTGIKTELSDITAADWNRMVRCLSLSIRKNDSYHYNYMLRAMIAAHKKNTLHTVVDGLQNPPPKHLLAPPPPYRTTKGRSKADAIRSLC